jgi:hypothetical protein
MSRVWGFFISLLLCWVMLTQASFAQDLQSPPLPEAIESVAPRRLLADDIPTEKISQFVQTYLQVIRLIDQREAELQGAETELESMRIQQKVEAEALALIQAGGLTLQEYLQLLGLANIDPEFGERIAAQLQEAN